MSKRILINKTWDGQQLPQGTSAYKVAFVMSAMTGDVILEIDAPYFNDPAPPMEPGKCMKVYDYEVVEIFIAAYPHDDESYEYSPYLEIQIGPHGHYNIVFFLQEADFKNKDASLELERAPVTKINTQTGRWTAEVAVPSFYLPEPVCGDDLSITWMMNAYAMHGVGEARQHFAHSTVPGEKPNFHQLRYFVPLVLIETMETRMTVDRSNSIASEKIRLSSAVGGSSYSINTGAAMGLSAGGGKNTALHGKCFFFFLSSYIYS